MSEQHSKQGSFYLCICWNATNPSLHKRMLHASAPLSAGSKDPYQVLGVKKDASAAEIKKVYFSVRILDDLLTLYLYLSTNGHQLARKYHPDTNPDKGARDKFVEIQDAYDVGAQCQLTYLARVIKSDL